MNKKKTSRKAIHIYDKLINVVLKKVYIFYATHFQKTQPSIIGTFK